MTDDTTRPADIDAAAADVRDDPTDERAVRRLWDALRGADTRPADPRVEAIADLLMDLRMDGPQHYGQTRYQDAMRWYAARILREIAILDNAPPR